MKIIFFILFVKYRKHLPFITIILNFFIIIQFFLNPTTITSSLSLCLVYTFTKFLFLHLYSHKSKNVK